MNLKKLFLNHCEDQQYEINKNQTDIIIPDLIFIDGGKGQYSTSRKVLDDYGFHDIPIIAIATESYFF